MNNKVQRKLEIFSARHYRRKSWYTSVVAMMLAVVFLTTSALTVPAVTLEKETYCGLEEHTHSDECLSVDETTGESFLSCGLEEHVHGESCYEKDSEQFAEASDSDEESEAAVDSELSNVSEVQENVPEVSDVNEDESEIISDSEETEAETEVQDGAGEESSENDSEEEEEEPPVKLKKNFVRSGSSADWTIDPEVDLEDYLNTTYGMTVWASSYTTSNTYFDLLFNFKYRGTNYSQVYYNAAGSYIYFGGAWDASMYIWYTGNNSADSVRYQTGTLSNGTQFFKLRVEGHNNRSNRSDASSMKYELFLFSNGEMFLNMIKTPTNGSRGSTYLYSHYENFYDSNYRYSYFAAEEGYTYFTPVDSNGYLWSLDYDLANPYTAEGKCGDNLNYSFDSTTGKLTITGTGNMYNWSSRNAPWNSFASMIKSVEISDGITSIGNSAFDCCTSLESINIPDSVASIGQYAFRYCASLKNITIPESVKTIGILSFYNCISLESAEFADGLTTIYDYAFSKCTALKSVDIPDSVTSIGSYAFYQCTALENASLPEGITTVNSYVFYGCTSLKNVNIPTTVKTIGSYAFYNCNKMESITIPEGVTNINDYAFQSCTSLRELAIPKSVQRIEQYAFNNCYALNKVTLDPDGSLTYIGNYAFSGGAKFASKIPANIQLGTQALGSTRNYLYRVTALITEDCSSLTSKYSNWTNVDTVYIPKTTENVNGSFIASFLSADEETRLVVEPNSHFTLNGAVSVSSNKFPNLSAGEYVSDSNGILYLIKDNAAYVAYCPSGITTVSIPQTVGGKTVKGVLSNAFRCADDVKTITFTSAKNITSLSSMAFANAEKLEKINNQTVDNKVIATFAANVSQGSMLFLNTKITAAVAENHVNKQIEIGSEDDKTKPFMVIQTENEMLDYQVLPESDENYHYVYYTGQTARNTVTISPQDSEGYKFNVYIKFLNKKGSLAYGVGEHTIVSGKGNNYTIKVTAVEPGFYKMQFPLLEKGDTIALSFASWVQTPTSSGGYELIWGEVFKDGEELEITEKLPDQYQLIEWKTVPKTFTLSSGTSSSGDFKNYGGSSNPQYALRNSSFYLYTRRSYTGINGGALAGDFATSVDYTDTFTLPDSDTYFDSDLINAITNGNWKTTSTSYQNTVYTVIDGERRDIFTVSTGDSSYRPEIKSISYDSSKKALTIQWRCNSSGYNTSEYPNIYMYVNFADEFIKVKKSLTDNLTSNVTLSINQNSSQTIHYSYSEDKTQTYSSTQTYTLRPATLTLNKKLIKRGTDSVSNNSSVYSTTAYMGSPYEYLITATKASGHTPYKDLRYVVDDLSSYLYITNDNMYKMLYKDTYGQYLTINITDATLCEPLSGDNLKTVTAVNGKEYSLSIGNTANDKNSYNGRVTSLTSGDHADYTTGNTLIITRSGNKLSVKVGDNAAKTYTCSSVSDLKKVMEGLGFIVTANTRYHVCWHLPDSTSLDDGASLELNVRSNTKNTFMVRDGDGYQDYQYWNGGYSSYHYYDNRYNYAYAYNKNFTPTTSTVSNNNTGYITMASCDTYYDYYPDNKLQRYGYSSNYRIYQDSYISQGMPTEAIIGDVLSLNVSFYNRTNAYDVLPVVEHIKGTQVLLAPVADNSGQPWAEGLETYTYSGGEYYILKDAGTYENVTIGGYLADRVVISDIESGKDTLIYWYMNGTKPNTVTIPVKTLFSPGYSGAKDYTKYSLSSEAYLNDHEYHRLQYGASTRIRYIRGAKYIVTQLSSDPESEVVSNLENVTIEEGNKVTYRLSIIPQNNDHVITFKGLTNQLYDALPKSTPGFRWSSDNVSVRYADAGGNDYTQTEFSVDGKKYTGVENGDDWHISGSYTSITENISDNQQYLIWGSDFKLNVYDSPVYIYVTMQYPDDENFKLMYDYYGYFRNIYSVGGDSYGGNSPGKNSLTFKKTIVKTKGDVLPSDDEVSEFSYVGNGQSIMYRVAFTPQGDGLITINNSWIYDQLPRSTPSYRWVKGTNVTNLKFVDENGRDYSQQTITVNGEEYKGVENPDNWNLYSNSSGTQNVADSNYQYIVWGSNFKLHLSNKPVYMYVTLTLPKDEEWEKYLLEQPNVDLSNFFYLNNKSSEAKHEIALQGSAILTTGVVGTGRSHSYLNDYSSDRYYNYFNQREDSRLYYYNDDQSRKVIDYYISLYNDGRSKLYVENIVDILPEGFTLNNYNGYVINEFTNSSYSYRIYDTQPRYYYTTGSSYTWAHNHNFYNYSSLAKITPEEQNSVTYKRSFFTYSTTTLSGNRQQITFNPYGYQNGLNYDSTENKFYLSPGQALVFSFSCYTNGVTQTKDVAENKVAMKYYDYNGQGVALSGSTVEGVDQFVSSKNDGVGFLYGNAGALANGFTGGANDDQWLASSVTVNRGPIRPGVVKSVSKVVSWQGEDTGNTQFAAFTDKITWQIEASNDEEANGTMRDYIVSDEMQYPFRYLDDVTVTLNYPNTTQSSRSSFSRTLIRFSSWGDNNDSVTFLYGNSNSKTLKTDGTWATNLAPYSNNDSSYYFDVRFTKLDSGNIRMDFRFKTQYWSLAPSAKLLMNVTTQVPTGAEQDNKLFYNMAYITPYSQDFDERYVTTGHLVDDAEIVTFLNEQGTEESKPSVKNSAQIPVSYGNVTSSYQKIEVADNSSIYAYSYDDDNYIVLPSSHSKITYSLAVISTQKAMKELIIIDNLPEQGDHETFDKSDGDQPRYSQFKVNFADNPNVRVVITPDGGSEFTLDPKYYEVQFTAQNSDFTVDDWEGTSSSGWFVYSDDPNSDYQKNKDKLRSFRIVIKDGDGFKAADYMTKKANVSIKFDAQVEGTPSAGESAWNTFGYHYIADNSYLAQEAAPTSLGLLMPSIPHIEKKLVDNDNNEYAAEEKVKFRFIVYRNGSIASLNALTDDSEIAAELASRNIPYTYCELEVDKNEAYSDDLMLDLMRYTYEDGEFVQTHDSFEWLDSNKYTVLELPIENQNYVYSNINRVTGNAYTFNYHNDKTLYIEAVNKMKLWKLSVVKTDDSVTPQRLSGAVFGFYSPFEKDKLSNEEIAEKTAAISNPERFTKPIESTIVYEGETYYLKDIAESPSDGTIIWSQLKMGAYVLTELKAPEGFRRDPTVYKFQGQPFGTESITVVNSRTLGYELPETGGFELYVYILGAVITAASMLLLYKKFRRSREG